MADLPTLQISKDSFLEPLDMRELAPRVRTPAERDALYSLVVEYCAVNDLLVNGEASADPTADLAWRVPGTSVLVRLGAPSDAELKALVGFALFILAAGAPPEAAALTPVIAALRRFRKLRAQYGERSIVEALKDVDTPNADSIFLELYGNPCRHPKAGCRFFSTESGTCAIRRDEVSELLAWLVDEEVLRQLNPNDPIEYGIAI